MTNIAFAGLTAAGKTTHARRLATDLGFDYVSATDILFEILRVPRDAHPWFSQGDAINAARQDGTVDAELESRLVDFARTRDRTVFDSWALAWICPVPVVRIWIESDLPSRARKCLVSLGGEPRPLGECEAVLRAKDDYNRAMFLRRHGFDLFRDRERYHAVLYNSHLIPAATGPEARRGIERFAPVVCKAALAVMGARASGLAELRAGYPREVLAVRDMHAGVACPGRRRPCTACCTATSSRPCAPWRSPGQGNCNACGRHSSPPPTRGPPQPGGQACSTGRLRG
jgi:cytidylate kinase